MRHKNLHIEIGENLEKEIESLKSKSRLKDPIPGFLWGSSGNSRRESLYLGLYDLADIPDEAPFTMLHSGAFRCLVVQEWLSEMLDGKELDIVEGYLSVLISEGNSIEC